MRFANGKAGHWNRSKTMVKTCMVHLIRNSRSFDQGHNPLTEAL